MSLSRKQFKIDYQGRPLTLEVSKLAGQANAAVIGRYGDTAVLVTAVMGKKDKDADYFPLVVDYEEKFYAAGKIKGSRFVKREGRPHDEAILTARLVDRAIRPLFPDGMLDDIQIVLTVLSYDGENDPDIPAILAASLALSLSDIAWSGPIAGVRVGRIEGKFNLNPTSKERVSNDLDVVMAGTEERINMLESDANEILEDDFASALEWGFKYMKELIAFQKKIHQKTFTQVHR